MNEVKVEFKYEFAEGLVKMIDTMVKAKVESDDEKLIIAGLYEVRTRLYKRMANNKLQYTMTLTPVQSLAMRLLFTEYITDHTSYMGIKLARIANEVQLKYDK